ncbi:MAG: Asp-tRNA(Asn)/Glu-tRNA(Gln) amidotransferase subunit GatA [Candidatus Pacebacteria bacterium]|nr:Asp-tRNA(Asn)/Glu-tRNA(Gln) amidotransferase subunit GatA [Candidatus Paceibacterota bacterium]
MQKKQIISKKAISNGVDLIDLTIARAHQGLIKKEFSALELTKAFLKKIEKFDSKIFAYLTLTPELAKKQAKKVDKMIAEEKKISYLAGIPMAVKDNILVEDVKCTAGSKILEDYIAPYSATVVEKLKEQEAVILGKTNLDEFAMGSSCEYSAFGPTKNPHNLEKVAGGSSGGSVAAVAGKMAIYSLGSDTCGSIRFPAGLCGVVGLKPSYGAVSRYGLIAMASSLDQIGPITKTVEDAEIVFNVIKGKDPLDSTSVTLPKIRNPQSAIRNLKIGIPKEYFIEGIDKEVKKLVEAGIKKLETLGAKIQEISLPHTKYALSTYYLIMPSEVSANLARYDGIRYGFSTSSEEKKKEKQIILELEDVYRTSRGKGFGNEVRRRIILGTYALSSGYYDAYYLRAQKVRTLIKKDFDLAFKKVDVILTPVSPTTAFDLGEKTKDPLSMYLSDIFMAAVNLAGLPAISIPCGKKGKMPVGLQIIAPHFQENRIFNLGKIFEQQYA